MLEVFNLLNGRPFRMLSMSIQNMVRAEPIIILAIHMATDAGSGLVPTDFRVTNGFTVFNWHLVDIENQLIQLVKIPHQIVLLPGDEVHYSQIKRGNHHEVESK